MKRRLRVDARCKRIRMYAFTDVNVYVWTGPEMRHERCEQNWRSLGLPSGKRFMTMPLRSDRWKALRFWKSAIKQSRMMGVFPGQLNF